MDLHLKQWRNQQQQQQQQQQKHESDSEQQPSAAKIPKLLLDLDPLLHHHHHHQHSSGPPSALPLFLPEPNSNSSSTKVSSNQVSAANPPDHHHSTNPRLPRMGSYFSMAQWQELELQALIYRYMLAGAAVPPELLQPIKKSLLHSPTYFLHHPLQHYSHYHPALLQSGYWGRAAMDPEPGRCRRTDGKKWRCSRDVVAGQKYCERHMHRGRNRSRKPVEIPTSTNITNNMNAAATPFGSAPGVGGGGGGGGATIGCGALKANGPNSFGGLSGPSPSIDLLHLNQSSSDPSNEDKGLFEAQNDGRVLRHFFDDWPRSLHEPSDNAGTNAATCLSISVSGNSSSSDVSLKLSTGNGDQLGSGDGKKDHQPQFNWAAGWAPNQVASMGGPLAEALRSSTTNSSPTSVLHRLPRAEATYVGT